MVASNAGAMINFAPTVLWQDPATRKLYLTVGDCTTEVLATTWIVIHVGWWENVRDQYFHKTYELAP
jgi:hypothetical protein